MKVSINQIIEAMEKHSGFITKAANDLGVTYQAIQQRVKKNKKLGLRIEAIQEGRLDISESELYKAIENGEAWAICFHLKCKGKKRGYVERQEVTGKDGKDLMPSQNQSDERAKRALAEMIQTLSQENNDKGA